MEHPKEKEKGERPIRAETKSPATSKNEERQEQSLFDKYFAIF